MNLSIEYLAETSGLTFKDINPKQCFRPLADISFEGKGDPLWATGVFYKWKPASDLSEYNSVNLVNGQLEYFPETQPVVRVFANLQVER